jgi:hypothetical protein
MRVESRNLRISTPSLTLPLQGGGGVVVQWIICVQTNIQTNIQIEAPRHLRQDARSSIFVSTIKQESRHGRTVENKA